MGTPEPTLTAAPSLDRDALRTRLLGVRRVTERLCAPLTVEDRVVPAMPLALRGGACATPCSRVRATHRTFFPPDARWQSPGIRPAGAA